MFWTREVHRDFFWAGFFTGALFGAVVGVLVLSDSCRETRGRVGRVAADLKDKVSTRIKRNSKKGAATVEGEGAASEPTLSVDP